MSRIISAPPSSDRLSPLDSPAPPTNDLAKTASVIQISEPKSFACLVAKSFEASPRL
jgi:hypothetical protein